MACSTKNPFYADGIQNGDSIRIIGTVSAISKKEGFGKTYLNVTLKEVSYQNRLKKQFGLTAIGQNIQCRMTPDDRVKIGRTLDLSGTLAYFDEAKNPGEFDGYQFYKNRGTLFSLQYASINSYSQSYSYLPQALYEIRIHTEELLTKYLSIEDAAVMKAMLLGNKNEISTETKELFQKNGIAHILAISGLHISLVGMTIFRLLKRLPIPLWCSIAGSEALIILYCMMVGFSTSSFRSMIMFSAFLLAKVCKRTYDIISALSLTCIMILIQNPLFLYDCAFLLSFMAIVGIAIFYSYFQANYFQPTGLFNSFFSSLFVFLATLPIMLYFYYETAFYAILFNLIVIPLMTLLMTTSVIMVISAYLFPFLTFLPAGIVSVILKIYHVSCAFLEQYGMGRVNIGQPSFFQILIYYLLLIGVLVIPWNVIGIKKKKQKKKPPKILFPIMKGGVLISGILVAVMVISLHPQRGLSICMLDVGQGDGCVIINENHNVYLIDGGSSSKKEIGKKSIIPYLKYRGINEMEAVFLSHPDEDHINGVEELLQLGVREHIHIRHIFVPKSLINQEGFDTIRILAKKMGTTVQGMAYGDVITDNDLQISCIYQAEDKEVIDLNDSSLVLSVDYREFGMLFTGDITGEVETTLLEQLQDNNRIGNKPYDVLKVAHHGSKFSTTTDFINGIQPKCAIISCGRKNPYGHPHKEVLERLENVGTKIVRTDEGGAILIQTNGEEMWVKSYLIHYCVL